MIFQPSTLYLYLLILLLIIRLPKCTCYTITESISDTVSSGDVTFYTVESTHPIIVALISDDGDTDIYASPTHKNAKPSSENYEVSSTMCDTEILVLMMNRETRKYTLGLYGHVRYDQSKYRLFIIEPSTEDIRHYQVWGWDLENNIDILLIDADYMVLVNDPKLKEFINHLESSIDTGSIAVKRIIKYLIDFAGVAMLKLLEIMIEVVL